MTDSATPFDEVHDLTIGQVVEHLRDRGYEVSDQKIRNYERRKLLAPRPRRDASSGYRLYGQQHIKQIINACNLVRLGFNLDEIATLMRERAPDDPQRRKLIESALKRARTQAQWLAKHALNTVTDFIADQPSSVRPSLETLAFLALMDSMIGELSSEMDAGVAVHLHDARAQLNGFLDAYGLRERDKVRRDLDREDRALDALDTEPLDEQPQEGGDAS